MTVYNNTSLARVVTYRDLFPTRRFYKIHKLLEDFSREKLMTLISNMCSKLVEKPFYNADFPVKGGIDMLRFCLSEINMKYLMECLWRYKKFASHQQSDSVALYASATKETPLYLLREVMAYRQHPVNNKRATDERHALMAILMANYHTIERESKVNRISLSNFSQELKLACLMISRFRYEDIVQATPKEMLPRQTLKCFKFFEFAEDDENFKSLLQHFKQKYGLISTAQYVTAFWGAIALSNIQEGVISFQKADTINQKVAHSIIDNCSIDSNAIIPKKVNSDYAAFRDKPFIRINQDEYLMPNVEFAIERIYNSLYFEFKNLWDKYHKDDNVSYNQYYTSNFSENFLFSETVEEIALCNNADVALDDEKCKTINWKIGSPPDFYIRKGNVVILFENKDVKINKSVKANGDLDVLLSEIDKRFVRDDKKTRGVGQLIRNAKRIRDGKFVWDANCPKDCIIYPVLVVADEKFTIFGLKNYLQYQQNEECKRQNLYEENVKPLILIDLATLAMYKDNFNVYGLVAYFEEYYSQSTYTGNLLREDVANKMMSFSHFINSKECLGLENMSQEWLEAMKQFI